MVRKGRQVCRAPNAALLALGWLLATSFLLVFAYRYLDDSLKGS